jgi:rhodanese-related sulfurtransferase
MPGLPSSADSGILECRTCIQGITVKFIIDNWLLFTVALASGGLLVWPALTGAGLTPGQAVQLINREKGVLIDVSEPAEFDQAHAGGARNVPMDKLDSQLADVVKNKATPIILVCPSGARARRAQAVARQMGFAQAQALAGGLKAWRDASLPIEKA